MNTIVMTMTNQWLARLLKNSPAVGLFFLVWLLSAPVHALTIDIVGGTESGVPVAIVPFEGEDRIADPVSDIIAANLSRTGLFAPIETAAMPERPANPDQLRLDNWRAGRAQYVVVGSIQPHGDGLRAEFHLLDVTRGDWLLGRRISAPSDAHRHMAHRISDIVYEEITGERGAFNTRIAYVKEQGSPGEQIYTLQIADADGANPVTILTSDYPIMSPTWSPDGQQLAYVSFEGNRAGIWVQDLGGSRYQLTAFPGVNGAPAWSPDGEQIAVALSKGENPNIHVIDLDSRDVRQLTHERGIDTEPDWLPDGSGLVFTSNRFGAPQIFRKSLDGGSAQRLTFDTPYAAGARVSPDGERIAMVMRDQRGYVIGQQALDNGTPRTLSERGREERPSYAPNGSMIIFASQTARGSELRIVPSVGGAVQALRFADGKVRDPAWGPFEH